MRQELGAGARSSLPRATRRDSGLAILLVGAIKGHPEQLWDITSYGWVPREEKRPQATTF